MTFTDIITAKIFTDESCLSRQLNIWRFKNKKIVFTNGCFDIIHPGHIDCLAKAAGMGDVLIVGLNSDESVKQLGKGKNRPLQNEHARTLILASLHFVDAVVPFKEATPYNLIRLVEPDVLVKGGDWEEKNIAGADIVIKKGGSVKLIPYLQGYSTTLIEQKIKEI